MSGFELREAPSASAPSPKAPVPADPSWTPLETWVWEKLQAGEIANIDHYQDDQGGLPSADPKNSEEWQDGRHRLSAPFLEGILLEDAYRSAIHRRGVRIVGAWFEDEIDLCDSELHCPLWLDRSRFEQAVSLTDARGRLISFDGSCFAANLSLARADIGQSLSLRDSAAFLEIDLAGVKIGGQLTMIGANVKGALDLERGDIGKSLFMRDGAEFEEIDLRGAKVGGDIDLCGAKVKGCLHLFGAEIGASLLMRDGAEFQEINALGVKVRGQISLVRAKVKGALDLENAEIGLSLMGGGTEFQEIKLIGAKVGGQISLTGAKVGGILGLHRADIGQSLFMRDGAEFQEVDVHSVKVAGQFDLSGAKINGRLVGEVAQIIGPAFLRRCEILDTANFINAVFEGGVFLGGTTIGQLDLRGARITGELNLASPTPMWREQGGVKSRLNLQNADSDAIQDGDQAGAWPDKVELDGFTYKRFGGLGADAGTDVAKQGSGWFIDWLAKDEPFTRQPYHQCASVLRDLGHPEMANEVLYESRERERHEIWAPWPGERGRGLRARLGRSLRWLKTMLLGRHPFPWHEEIRRSFRWFGLSLLAFVVGYGYGTRLFWRPLAWAALIVAIGIRVTYSDPSAFADSSLWWRTFFSLDMLLSIVELSREHTLVQAGLDGLAYGWFVMQNLLGWVLALFLIAGLTGLTK